MYWYSIISPRTSDSGGAPASIKTGSKSARLSCPPGTFNQLHKVSLRVFIDTGLYVFDACTNRGINPQKRLKYHVILLGAFQNSVLCLLFCYEDTSVGSSVDRIHHLKCPMILMSVLQWPYE